MVTDDNIELIKRMFRDVAAHGWDELLNYYARDVVVSQAPSLPYGGDWHGHDGLRELGQRYRALWKRDFNAGLDEHHYAAGDNLVVTQHRFIARSAITDRKIDIPVAEFFFLRAGKVIKALPFYWDSAAVNAVHQPQPVDD